MINFPIFDRLDIKNYGLFPGAKESEPGLHIQFLPGLTLVLGANGLGKTTLVRIIFRILTGPYDIPRIEDSQGLGTKRLEAKALSIRDRKTFADRVMDGAKDAEARLSFGLGSSKVVVERRLSDLRLLRLTIDSDDVEIKSEKTYQKEITKLAGTSSYGDWILLLRFLIFYFEDRRALVWDPSAQKQILRILLLNPKDSKRWTKDEREILELDSRMRNLNAAIRREERALAEVESKLETSAEILAELSRLTVQQQADDESYERLEGELVAVDLARRQARQRLLNSEQERESQFRAIERTKLATISSKFPSQSETARYILAQLLSDQVCIVCGTHVPGVEADFVNRIAEARCVVCGSDLTDVDMLGHEHSNGSDAELKQKAMDLADLNVDIEEAARALADVETEYDEMTGSIDTARDNINDRSRRIALLVRRLPPDEAEIHDQRSGLDLMHEHIDEMRSQLESLREQFGDFVENVNQDIAVFKDEIKASFDQYAEGFLLEICQLTWSPQKAKIGQTGSPVDFPAFQLDMTGSDFPTPVRRNTPQQVSESQREFIDLAFRMALMSVASGVGSSLIIDAPESSLDAVFAPRAADVFSLYSSLTPGNRLIITSNLVEGQLLPSLIGLLEPEERSVRVTDLVEIAEPTAAVREKRSEYERVIGDLLASAPSKGIDEGTED